MKTVKNLRGRRKFSKDFKLDRIKQFESGELTIRQICRMYKIHEPNLYSWIEKYSRVKKAEIVVVEKNESTSEKISKLEEQLNNAHALIGKKQVLIEYLEKLIELAEKKYEIDIKKNSNTKQSNGS